VRMASLRESWTKGARRLAPALGVPFALGALHHLAVLFSPEDGESSSPTRHFVFVGINLLFGAAFVFRARWVLFPAIVLAIQQTSSHGGAFLEARRAGAFDAQSFFVLCFLPAVLTVAFALARRPPDSPENGLQRRGCRRT
jgi:hypothetical protein